MMLWNPKCQGDTHQHESAHAMGWCYSDAMMLCHGLKNVTALVCRAKAQDDWTKDLPLPSFMKGHGKRAIDQTAVDDTGSIAPS
jgi:hypothetical protein